MKEYTVLLNSTSPTEIAERMNKMTEDHWIIKFFTDNLTVYEREVEEPEEVIQING